MELPKYFYFRLHPSEKGTAVEIEDASDADVVEIIRCKDCKYGVDYYHEGDCYCLNPKWGMTYFRGSWEFYCAEAERRTDDSISD